MPDSEYHNTRPEKYYDVIFCQDRSIFTEKDIVTTHFKPYTSPFQEKMAPVVHKHLKTARTVAPGEIVSFFTFPASMS